MKQLSALLIAAVASYSLALHAQDAQEQALHDLGVLEAAQLISSGDVQAVELIEHLLQRIEDYDALHAFISIDREGASAAANTIDAARGRGLELGVLAGVPLVIKDNINTSNLRTTGGTPALEGFQPVADAQVVQRLVAAGAIVLGKANLHELAFGITSANARFGFVTNAYSPDHFAGGSSGGTAAAIAARLAPGGLGTDTGGSVRIPAALNGIAGLRPTQFRYPQEGLITLSRTRDTAGPMGRSVQDLIVLDNVITGYDQPIEPYDLGSLRLGVPSFFWSGIESRTLAIAESLLDELQRRGVSIIEVSIESIDELVPRITGPLTQYEIRRDLPRYLAEYDTGLRWPELLTQVASPDVRRLLESGAFASEAPSAVAYRESIEIGRPALRRAYFKTFVDNDIDALVFPTTVRPAGRFSEIDNLEHNGRTVSAFATYVRNTEPASLAGFPGLSLPIGLTDEGLPVGIELDGLPDSDRRLLAIGLAIENLTGPMPAPD